MSSSDLIYHAVHYNVAFDHQKSAITLDDLKERKIEYIRIIWVDLISQVRSRTVPLEYFEKLLGISRPGIALTKATLGIVFITLAPGFGYVYRGFGMMLPDRD
jgi:hypothetical protein